MRRRSFLRHALEITAGGLLAPSLLGRGGPFRPLRSLAGEQDPFDGRILVLVNLAGGNDGLNTVVPYSDPQYAAVRPTLAFAPGEVLQIEPGMGIGLHPSLTGFESLYNEGKLAIVQGCGYPSMNLSHFRGTDIWFSGSGAEEVVETGWIARFLERMYPTFPLILPEAPYGLQQSLRHSLPLRGERGTTGVIVDNPDSFYNLVNAYYEGPWEDEPPGTRGGDELRFVRQVDTEALEYAGRIQQASAAGTNTVAYPGTGLGLQLETAARLISGDLGTPIFVTAEYGFDTHASQLATHASLLGSVGHSILAFLTDLANQGLSDRVLVMTVSEFGRRVEENGSLGCDHGTAAPIFLAGDPVIGGMYGASPDLLNLDENGNLQIQHDYRTVYSTVLQDFFGTNPSTMQDVLGGDFGTMGLITPTTDVGPPGVPAVTRLHPPAPNPVSAGRGRVDVRFDLAQSRRVRVEVFDVGGRRMAALADHRFEAGAHTLTWRFENASAGVYLVRLSTSGGSRSRKIVLRG